LTCCDEISEHESAFAEGPVPNNQGERVHEEDLQLVSRMLAGDKRACDAFFAAYAKPVAAFVSRRSQLPPASIEDVVQNCFFKAIRNLTSFRGEAALFTWLCGICRHELATLYRETARRPVHASLDSEGFVRDTVLEMHAPSATEPHHELDLAADRFDIVTTLNRLPDRYARALDWKYGDGFSVDEVAGMLGLSTMAAQSLLARARVAFKDRWQCRPAVFGDPKRVTAHHEISAHRGMSRGVRLAIPDRESLQGSTPARIHRGQTKDRFTAGVQDVLLVDAPRS
jgi:RNA polymerase sigma-70 factor, ECF subfamily